MEKVNTSIRNQSIYVHVADQQNTKQMKVPHLHHDYEIYYLVQGERFYRIQGQEFKVHENQMVFIDRNTLHQTFEKQGVAHQRIVLNFHGSFLTSSYEGIIQELFAEGPHVLTIPDQDIALFNQLFYKMTEEYQAHDPYAQLYLQNLLSQLLIESRRILTTHEENIFVDKRYQHHVSELLGFIHSYYYLDLSLRFLSERFHLNEHYISRMFKQVTGYSFTSYVNRIRVAEAERLLKETNLQVNQIASQVGYTTNVHFYRMFREIVGIAPSAFRRKKE
ncbi:AraC family transcriptional regulator [Gracilibacillus halophilus YIM-C55.5]|uniref:AraC family transcriptional regulator n=1 Tax=Gracilibacillus halophilus YIM-C55.5 TaxID=1308866 RepID=N4WPG4_9BACI|nr:AraC family transcriptional regulator [Gracilibacillus halophilus]ENH98007.1 AraC family transcriptional regulator [Gracilibacillus halophilus YIM-C55.5]